MLSTPLTCCSIGVATDCSTVTASAPVNDVWTWIWGGTMFGYCAIGKRLAATTPTKMVTIAITIAMTGRAMKNLPIAIYLGAPASVGVCSLGPASGRRVW